MCGDQYECFANHEYSDIDQHYDPDNNGHGASIGSSDRSLIICPCGAGRLVCNWPTCRPPHWEGV